MKILPVVRSALLLLVTSVHISSSANLTIGVLVERSNFFDFPFGINRTIGIIHIGINKTKEILGESFTVEFLITPVDCRTCTYLQWGAHAARMYYVHNVSGFIGPGCSTAVRTVARMAATWNVPIVTYVGIDEALGNKNEFKTLTRLSHNNNLFAKFYMAVFNWFGWNHIANLYDQVHYLNNFIGESLQRSFEKAGIKSIAHAFNSGVGHRSTVLRQILQKASTAARVFLVSAHGDVFREMMLIAQELGMTSGDYVFIIFFQFNGDPPIGNIHWARGDNLDQKARKAYESVKCIRPRRPIRKQFFEFESEVKARALRDYNYTFQDGVEVNTYNIAHYSAFVLYAIALKETLAANEDPRDGASVVSRMWNRTFPGIGGIVSVNENGDVDTDFSLLDISPVDGHYRLVGQYLGYRKKFELIPDIKIQWPNNRGPPVDVPHCGFNGERCRSFTLPLYAVVAVSLGFVIILVSGVGYYSYRRIKKEADLNSLWWKIKWEDINISDVTATSFKTISDTAEVHMGSARVGVYKGTRVHLKKIPTQFSLTIDRHILVELQKMRDLTCTNLSRFVGLCPDIPNVYIVTEHCARGSLQEILQNESIQLDWDFRVSLINDIVKGMDYLHGSPIGAHGQLNSFCCAIDSRFVLKICNFGLKSIRAQTGAIESDSYKLLWVGPEHLRLIPVRSSSKAGDVYSFAIILYEMCHRVAPYANEIELNGLQEVLGKVRRGGGDIFRPMPTEATSQPELEKLMNMCWKEEPEARPSFHEIQKFMQLVRKNKIGGNVLDVLLHRMSQYANNLEGLVEERTNAFLEEKRKSEALLYQVLPKSVANCLRVGKTVDPESFECVTIYFSDIVGFTSISAASSPFQVVDLLNDLYTCFDGVIDSFDVYKVETIGDAYMVVSGLPNRNGNDHVQQIAKMSLCILDNVKRFKIRHLPNTCLEARIGLHSGSVCAGVVGRKMPRYCLFGDTVNTASRIESHGEAMKIHISEPTKELLELCDMFQIVERGMVNIKGKGPMKTFWLVGQTLVPISTC